MLPSLLEVLLIVKDIGLSLHGPSDLLLDLLVVLSHKDSMVLFWVFKRVADELHPQRLQFYLLDLLLLQSQCQRSLHSHRKMPHTFIQLPYVPADHQLLLEGFVELQHVEVRHQYEIIHGSLFQSLHYEVVHNGEVVEEVAGGFIDEEQGLVELMHPVEGLKDGDESVDDVVQFEDPDESDLAAPAEDIIVGDLALPTGMVQLFVGRQLHKIVVKRDEQLLANEDIQILGFGLDLVVFELTRPREDLDLLIQNDIADVELTYLADLDQHHHYFQLAAAAALLLELLYQRFQQGLLLRFSALLLEQQQGLADGLGCQRLRDQVQLFQLFQVGVLLEQGVHQLHSCFLYIIFYRQGNSWQQGTAGPSTSKNQNKSIKTAN